MTVTELKPEAEVRLERRASAEADLGEPAAKRPWLFVAVFAAWAFALVWFHPRMWSLIDLAPHALGAISIAYFVIFAEIAWLYGLYNIAIICFALADRQGVRRAPAPVLAATRQAPAVAVLYVTCNDFVERSAASCLALNYPNYRLYLLDDSSTEEARGRVDAFAAAHADQVIVVRRPDRRGFKAGNLNHALGELVREPYFAVVDADEILPPDFLQRLVPRLEANAKCGFVQANHRSFPGADTKLARDLGPGIDIHWKWYQPLRNRYGFVMFLGHGAVLRRSCWEEVGGFPEIVSEDLGYAIALRERGYFGAFVEDVVCYEEFPETVRAFRVRHVKWTRGTCEFLHKWGRRLLGAKRISTVEKMDILFPTLNLPLTFFFFLFMINAAVALPLLLGEVRNATLVLMGREFVFPVFAFRDGVERVFGLDFFAITLVTILAPVMCFIIELARRPLALLRFLAHSTALYAALSPLTFAAVVGYAATGRATFLVTGAAEAHKRRALGRTWRTALEQTHPDSAGLQRFEMFCGAAFLIAAIATLQVSFIGLAIGFALLPLMHRVGWENAISRRLVWLPGFFVFLGVCTGIAGVAGLQPVFFGFGFHF